MDIDQAKLQFLGVFGIYRKAYKILVSSKKLFTQVTVALILPATFLFVAHIPIISHYISQFITISKEIIPSGFSQPTLNKLNDTSISFVRVVAFYWVLNLVFSLLSTAGVVYAIACLNTGKEIPVPLKKILWALPRIWKRLMVTFLWNFMILLGYISLFFFVCIVLSPFPDLLVSLIVQVLFILGYLYINVIWGLANVISVFEDIYGFEAFQSSSKLIKGKVVPAGLIFVTIRLAYIAIEIAFLSVNLHGSLKVISKVGLGFFLFLLLSLLSLLDLIIHTVIYFVCKSYHHKV